MAAEKPLAAWGWRLLFGLLRVVLPTRRLTGTTKAPDRIPYA